MFLNVARVNLPVIGEGTFSFYEWDKPYIFVYMVNRWKWESDKYIRMHPITRKGRLNSFINVFQRVIFD